jgi:anti-anti-sigma regulatory factor
MADTLVDVHTDPDGSLVVQPHGSMDDDCAVHFRQILVHAVRRTRPLRLILDLSDVPTVDPINLGTLAALCDLADDHHVIVFMDNAATQIAHQLQAAGVPRQRLRTRPPSPASLPSRPQPELIAPA